MTCYFSCFHPNWENIKSKPKSKSSKKFFHKMDEVRCEVIHTLHCNVCSYCPVLSRQACRNVDPSEIGAENYKMKLYKMISCFCIAFFPSRHQLDNFLTLKHTLRATVSWIFNRATHLNSTWGCTSFPLSIYIHIYIDPFAYSLEEKPDWTLIFIWQGIFIMCYCHWLRCIKDMTWIIWLAEKMRIEIRQIHHHTLHYCTHYGCVLCFYEWEWREYTWTCHEHTMCTHWLSWSERPYSLKRTHHLLT